MLSQTRQGDLRTVLDAIGPIVASPELPGRVVLVTGETGIGKSYLANAVGEALTQKGAHVVSARANPVERAVPYAVVDQILDALNVERELPLAATADTGNQEPVLDVCLSVAAQLRNQAAHTPMLVVIDDLHYADEDTFLLLGFLARMLRKAHVAWLVTARTHTAEPVPGYAEYLQRMHSEGCLRTVDLAPLPDSDIGELIESTIGREPEPVLADTIIERAAGNPFFAIQFALAAGDVGSESEVVPAISRRVGLLERLLPLGGIARTVARLSAVLGEVDLSVLEGVGERLDHDIGQLRDGFDRLLDAGLLTPAKTGRHHFTHDLVREIIYEDIGPGERRRVHEAIANTLLHERSRGAAVDLVELARHLSLSSIDPSVVAADALMEAGDALTSISPRSAALRYRQAVKHLPPGSAQEAVIYARLARALHRSGDPQEVLTVCRNGLMSATGAERDSLTRYLAMALADTGATRDALGVIEQELTNREDSAELHNTRTLFLRILGDFDEALASIERASTLARSGSEQLAVLSQRLHLVPDLGALQARADQTVDEVERLLPSLPPEARLLGHTLVAGTQAGMGQIRQSLEHLEAAEKLEHQGTPMIEWSWTFAPRVVGLVRMNHWDEAFEAYDQGAAQFISGGVRLQVRAGSSLPVIEAARHRRDTDLVLRCLDDVVDVGIQAEWNKDYATAQFELLTNDRPSAAKRFERIVARSSHPSLFRLSSRFSLLDNALVSDSDREETLDALRADVDANGTVFARAIGAIAALRFGGPTEAGVAAMDECRSFGLTQHEVLLQLELGLRGESPEVNLRTAYDSLRTLRAPDLVARAERGMRQHGVRVPSVRRRDRFALTDAEQRVASLVAEGLPNREIADRLAYSINTIETYLSRVYAKTGCANRVELARRMNLYGNPHSTGKAGEV